MSVFLDDIFDFLRAVFDSLPGERVVDVLLLQVFALRAKTCNNKMGATTLGSLAALAIAKRRLELAAATHVADREELAAALPAARAMLDAQAYEQAWATGSGIKLHAALRLGLRAEDEAPTAQ
jgi:hypothetical protein